MRFRWNYFTLALLASAFWRTACAQSPHTSITLPLSNSDPKDLVAIQPQRREPENFHWGAATRQALFYTGVMHAFRYSTESGTRKTLKGPWLKNYGSSIAALRGWEDGDTFITEYVGHPMEGAIFTFIQQQNDPKYRMVQWNSGRDYWIGRLRGLAFSAAWSTQWKLGPASEASLGNVQLHEHPGFIDLVVTPILGLGVAMGEDAADRYLITGLENPTRSFANLMAFKEPWYRPARSGLFKSNFIRRKELVAEYREGISGKPFEFVRNSDWHEPSGSLPQAAPVELISSVHYENFLGGGTCIGGGGSGAARLSSSWQIVAEASGCKVLGLPQDDSADSLFYAAGPRWTPRAARRFSPYAQMLVGGRKVSYEIADFAKKEELLRRGKAGDPSVPQYPNRSDWNEEESVNGLSLALGGGFDVVLNRAWAWRVANLEYTRSWLPNVETISPSEGVRFTSGVVLRIGTW